LTKLGGERIATELASTNTLLAVFTERAPTLFRPPYGGLNATVRDVVRRAGLTIVLWGVDSQDWRDHIPESIAQRTLGQLRGNGRGIVLLHDIHLQTARALPLIMQGLRRDGFRVVPLATALP
jgi:peptidoglycan/xylan/chitin deacetylase (PgdA/CDA1 family)